MIRIILLSLILISPLAAEEEASPPMTLELLGKIVLKLDSEAQSNGPMFQMTVDGVPVLIVTDVEADRMRAMVQIRSAEGLSAEELQRLMQANFDSALDARYAVAQGQLWGVFIHPLSPLERDQFISGIAQTVNLAKTYGTLYSSGVMQFKGGDSPGLQRQLIDRLLKKGREV